MFSDIDAEKNMLPVIKQLPFSTTQVGKLLGIGDQQVSNQEVMIGLTIQRVPAGVLTRKVYRVSDIFKLATFRRSKGLTPEISPMVMAVYNAKGGVGKSTTSVELAVQYQAMGYRVLLVDTDPQGNATVLMGYDPELTSDDLEEEEISSEYMTNFHFGHLFSIPPYFDPKTKGQEKATYADFADVVKMPCGPLGPHLIPADFWLQDLEFALQGAPNRDWLVHLLLTRGKNNPDAHIDLTPYDIIIFDCPPSASLLTRNVLIASDLILAPIGLDKLSVKGMGYLAHLVQQLHAHYQKIPPVLALPTRYQKTRTRSVKALEILHHGYGDMVAETMISDSEAVCRNQGDNDISLPLSLVKPQEKVSLEYRKLGKEIIRFIQKQQKGDVNEQEK